MICKIWGIGCGQKSLLKGIKASLAYVTDSRKTAGGSFEDENTYLEKDKDVTSVLRYMQNDEKTKRIFVSGYMCSPATAAEEFALTKTVNLARVGRELSDDTGNKEFHILQSFPDDINISDEEVHQCGIDLVKKLGKYQAVIASHVQPVFGDDGKLHGKARHNHIIINSHMNPEFVDENRPEKMKYHDCNSSYDELRRLNDEVALEHGLPVIEAKAHGKSCSLYELEEKIAGRSWKEKVREDIIEARNCSSSWEEFIKLMADSGYEIREGKHETYITPGSKRVRGSTLGDEYTKKSMQGYWEIRKSIDNRMISDLVTGDSDEKSISYSVLKDLLQDENTLYFFKIPKINAVTGENYSMFYPLTDLRDDKTVHEYFKEGTVYPLYRDKTELIGTVKGDIAAALMTGEAYIEENEMAVKEEIAGSIRREKNGMVSRYGWKNSVTGKTYYIPEYDDEGNRIGLLEQLLLLAYTIITRESPEWIASEVIRRKDNIPITLTNETEMKRSRVIDALKILREEEIETESDLKMRLDETGKEISTLQRKKKENDRVKSDMKPIANLVSLLGSEGTEEDRRMAGSILRQRYSIDTEEEIRDFNNRFEECLRLEKSLNARLKAANRRYTRLKKLQHQLELSEDRNYCYSRDGSISHQMADDWERE